MIRYRHETLSPGVFSSKLTELSISEAEFSRMTGVRSRTIDKWLDREGEGPPFWVSQFLNFMTDQELRDEAHQFADEHLIEEEQYRAERDARAEEVL